MAQKSIIEPRILKGTRDFLPLTMVKRLHVLNTIRGVFQRYGYSPIETPILSYADTILGKYGEEGDRLTYHFEDAGGRHIALPYDLTVPTARFVAAHAHELPMPFKRYQIQRVWRAEKPQKGRLREFYQCDIDIVGTTNRMADAEIAKLISEVFGTLGFNDFKIKVNSRRLMNAILADLGLDDNPTAVIRAIDKMDKIGREGVTSELEKLGVPSAKIKTLFDAFESRDFSAYDTSEIDEFLELCRSFSIPEGHVVFDPYLARGLDYYTGIIFETVIESAGMGSVAGGGRYDDLCGIFSKESFSGVGVSFGFERLMLILEERGLLDDIRLSTQVLVTQFDADQAQDALALLTQLTEAGVRAEVYFEPAKLAKQFKYASRKGIPFVVVRGPEEIQNNTVALKNMATGEQQVLPLEELISTLTAPLR